MARGGARAVYARAHDALGPLGGVCAIRQREREGNAYSAAREPKWSHWRRCTDVDVYGADVTARDVLKDNKVTAPSSVRTFQEMLTRHSPHKAEK